MKKLSFILAMMIVCGAIAACGDDSNETSTAAGAGTTNPPAATSGATTATTTNGTPDNTEPAATTTAADPGATTPETTGNDTGSDPTATPTEGEDQPQDELIDGARFSVDGDLSDWDGLATMSVIGEAFTEGKKAIFYGALTTDGLYLACDAYHQIYTTGKEAWFENSNFEIFVDSGSEQLFVYAAGIGADCYTGIGDNATGKITQAVMVTTEVNESDTVVYHTITEVFISNDDLPEDVIWENTVSVGVAWKTVSDLIIGSQYAANADGTDEYWSVKGDENTWQGEHAVNRCAMVATPRGLFWFDDYFED